jgi:uncharacterized membrane protein YccC
MRARDVLYRFRPAGAPGAASATGVPADRVADLTAELQPLFAELTRTERECADIIARAGLAAAQVHAQAMDRAAGLVPVARERVDGERAAAVARVRERGAQESAAALAAAEQDAAQVHRRAEERMASFVDSVLASVGELVDTLMGEPVADPPGPGDRPGGGP